MKKTLIIIGIVIVLLVAWGWSSYNGFVSANEAVNNQWAQVETQYQRRLDLFKNLVGTVKGATKEEQTVFSAAANAIAGYNSAHTVDAKAQAATQADTVFAKVLALGQAYPQLASMQAFQDLQTEIEGTENRVSVERKRFNDMVQTLNVMTKRFPSSIIASMFGYKERPYFQSAAGAENAPTVEF
jgi:LemA protein